MIPTSRRTVGLHPLLQFMRRTVNHILSTQRLVAPALTPPHIYETPFSHATPPPTSFSMGIRVAIKPEYQITPPNVHHAGQPMPGEEQEDIVMTSTQSNLRNVKCPLTGKPVTELDDPVRSLDCKHIYEKKPIMQHIRSKSVQGSCPVAGCPKKLQADRLVCDPLLLIEIDEMRAMSKQQSRADVIEDITELGEED